MSGYFPLFDTQVEVVVSDDALVAPPSPVLGEAKPLPLSQRDEHDPDAHDVLVTDSGVHYAVYGELCEMTDFSQVFLCRQLRRKKNNNNNNNNRYYNNNYDSYSNNSHNDEEGDDLVLKRALPKGRDSAEREIATLQTLPAHANLLPLIEAFELSERETESETVNNKCGKHPFALSLRRTFLCMIMPACEWTLTDYLNSLSERGESLPRTYVQHILTQLVDVLQHCERHGVAHGDICPQNILVNEYEYGSPHVYLIDFGTALHLRRDREQAAAGYSSASASYSSLDLLPYRPSMPLKRFFASPESLGLTNNSYFHPMMADVWSLGLVFFALLTTGLEMFEDEESMERIIFEHIEKNELALVLNRWDAEGKISLDYDALDLLVRMLHIDPLRRPQLEEILNHPYLSADAFIDESDAANIATIMA